MTKNELMSLAIKAWRPPAWAVGRNKQKKAALKEKGKAWLTNNMDTSAAPGGSNPHNNQNSPTAPAALVAADTMVLTPISHAPLEERITSIPARSPPAQEQRHIPIP